MSLPDVWTSEDVVDNCQTQRAEVSNVVDENRERFANRSDFFSSNQSTGRGGGFQTPKPPLGHGPGEKNRTGCAAGRSARFGNIPAAPGKSRGPRDRFSQTSFWSGSRFPTPCRSAASRCLVFVGSARPIRRLRLDALASVTIGHCAEALRPPFSIRLRPRPYPFRYSAAYTLARAFVSVDRDGVGEGGNRGG